LLADATPGGAFGGPWDATHMPAPLATPNVTAQAAPSEAYEVRIGSSVSCPAGKPVDVTVSFSDPSGSQAAALGDPCAGGWVEPQPNYGLDFSLRTFPGVAGVLEPAVTFVSANSTPFVYEVSTPAGPIARGALLATIVPPRVVDSRHHQNEYVTLCVDGKQEVRSTHAGDKYCEVGGGTNYTPGDWPQPAPRKPRYPALTIASAPYWTEIAVEYHFGYRSAPAQYRASACAPQAAGRVSCEVSWRSASYLFAGPVKVGAANVYTGRYRYALRIVRTDLRTHQRRTFVTG
jgi:hypothetical protein